MKGILALIALTAWGLSIGSGRTTAAPTTQAAGEAAAAIVFAARDDDGRPGRDLTPADLSVAQVPGIEGDLRAGDGLDQIARAMDADLRRVRYASDALGDGVLTALSYYRLTMTPPSDGQGPRLDAIDVASTRPGVRIDIRRQ